MSMLWCIVCVLVWLGELTLLPVPVRGAAPGEQERRAILQAENLEYASLEHRLIASGAVTLIYGQTRLFADRVELNTETGVGFASGQVRFLTPEDDIRASRLEFELSLERGVLYDAVGVIAQSYMVAGKRIARLDSRSLAVYQGQVTTCTNTVPDWAFRAREARIGLGDYVTLKHPSLWIRGIPVFYLPYLAFPLEDERTTGFLPPHVGGSRRDGAIVGTAFFWAIADWMDATFGLEYLSEKGWRPEVEFRYAIDPQSDGQIRGSFIHDQNIGEDRWKIAVQQRQEFGWDIRGLTQLDLRSERDLDREFSRDISLESVVQTDSFIVLTKGFPDSVLSVAGELHEAIRDSGSETTFRRLPVLRLAQFPTSILGVAFLAVETSYARLSDTEVTNETPVQRLDFFPHLIVPISLQPWINLTFTGGVRETWYDRRVTAGSDISRELFDLRVHLQGPLLWRHYGDTEGSGVFIHLVEPRIAYRYVPQVAQDDIPPFEVLDEAQHFLDPFENMTLVDRIVAVNYVKLSLVNRLFARRARGSAYVGAQEIIRFVVSQGLDFRESALSDRRLLGALDMALEMRLWQKGWMTSTVRLAPSTGDLQESNWRLQFAIRPGWIVHVANQYRGAPDVFYVSGGVQLVLRDGLEVGYTWRYDAQLEMLREHQATLSYRAQCWRLDLRLRWRESGDTEFVLRFNLWHL